MAASQKIKTFLWFDDAAEEAVTHYIDVFGNGRVLETLRRDGKVLTMSFELFGQQFIALNGGPHFKFTEAISLQVDCDSQAEVDALWEKLTANGGTPSQCGWLKDRFGLSWQITPVRLMELVMDADPARAKRAFDAMMQMTKIDIAALERAADGR